jgi:hypothetical protein
MYYSLQRIDDPAFGVGYAPEDYSFDVLSEGKYCNDWRIVPFHLRDGGFADYQMNDLDWPLCSIRLKTIIDKTTSPRDHIQWLPAKVINNDEEEREYFILHLPERVDVIDKQKSIITPDNLVVRPHFNVRAIGDHQVFSYPGGEFSVIVSEAVKGAILSHGCIGIDFSKVQTSGGR